MKSRHTEQESGRIYDSCLARLYVNFEMAGIPLRDLPLRSRIDGRSGRGGDRRWRRKRLKRFKEKDKKKRRKRKNRARRKLRKRVRERKRKKA